MPRVPQVQPIQEARPAPAVRLDPNVPEAAFGGGQSAAAVSGATKNLLGAVESIAVKAKQNADDVVAQNAAAQIQNIKNDLTYNDKYGAMTKRGKDAFGVVDEYGEKFDKAITEITDNLNNQDQKAMVMKYALGQKSEFSTALQKHTFTEAKAYDDQTTKSLIDAGQNDAILNYQNAGAVEKGVQQQIMAITSNAQRNGIPLDSEVYKAAVRNARSGTQSAVIGRMVDNGQYGVAEQYYNQVKDQIDGADAVRVEKTMEAGKVIHQGNIAWAKYKTMTFADGMPDIGKIEGKVMSDPNLSEGERLKVADYVRARAREQIANTNMANQAEDKDFMNTLIKTRQGGASLEDALKLVPKYSRDPMDQQAKLEAVKKTYAPPSESDPRAKYALWEGIQEGKTTAAAIDEAFNQGKINATDWNNLKQDRYKAEIEGRSPEMKSTQERIRQLAVENFGTDKDLKDKFILEVNDAGRGKSPDEVWKIANDKLKVDPTTQNHFLWINALPYGGTSQYKTDEDRRRAESLAFGKASEDIGATTLQAIKIGAARTGAKEFKPADFENFANSLGGYDEIKPGTNTYNAIQSLMKKNKPVVVENIKAVLEKYPDGKF